MHCGRSVCTCSRSAPVNKLTAICSEQHHTQCLLTHGDPEGGKYRSNSNSDTVMYPLDLPRAWKRGALQQRGRNDSSGLGVKFNLGAYKCIADLGSEVGGDDVMLSHTTVLPHTCVWCQTAGVRTPAPIMRATPIQGMQHPVQALAPCKHCHPGTYASELLNWEADEL